MYRERTGSSDRAASVFAVQIAKVRNDSGYGVRLVAGGDPVAGVAENSTMPRVFISPSGSPPSDRFGRRDDG